MKLSKKAARVRRHYRVRAIVSGTSDCPRVCIFRSNRHISAQVIDDAANRTLAAVTTMGKETKAADKNHCNRANAEKLGKQLGEKLKAQGISKIVFDRNGFIYHGIVKAFADALRGADEAKHFEF